MRAVLDANVLVSALISERGSPARILALWEREAFELVVSPFILEEMKRVLHYPRIQERYRLPNEHITSFLGLLGSLALLVHPADVIDIISQDPDDNRYLDCALTGEASYLVSGDQHLLTLGEFEGVIILPPAGFLALLDYEGY